MSRAVAACQRFDFLGANQVEIAVDRMLQCRSRNREFQRFTLRLLGQQTMNQTAGERITASDPVNDRVDLIPLGLVEFLAVINQRRPAVMRG